MNHLEDEGSLFALIRESLTNHLQPTVISVHASIGHYIAHVDNYYQRESFVEAEEVGVPDALRTEEAKNLLRKLINARRLSEELQPIDLSGTEQALLARVVSEKLEINDVWQVFGRLWNIKPETLRKYYNRAFEQKKSLEFQDYLRKIIG